MKYDIHHTPRSRFHVELNVVKCKIAEINLYCKVYDISDIPSYTACKYHEVE